MVLFSCNIYSSCGITKKAARRKYKTIQNEEKGDGKSLKHRMY